MLLLKDGGSSLDVHVFCTGSKLCGHQHVLLQRPFPFCKTQVWHGDGAAVIEPSKMMFLSGRSHLAGYRSYLALWSEKEPCFHHGLDETLRTDQY